MGCDDRIDRVGLGADRGAMSGTATPPMAGTAGPTGSAAPLSAPLTAPLTAPRHVVVVGCGFAGTSALWQLVHRHPVERVTVLEASGEFGPGFAYRERDCPDYLVNNTTDTMCLAPTHRGAFIDWLRMTGHPGAAEPGGHLPRAEFGSFLREVVRASLVGASIRGIRVDLVPQEATGIEEPPEGGVTVRWAGGEVRADAVLLATGRCPAASRVAPPPPGASARFFATHVCRDELDALPADATVHVLGASLSAYDVANRLFSPRTGAAFVREPDGTLRFEGGPNARRLVLMSRSGRLKKVGGRSRMPIRRTRLVEPVLAALAAERGGLTLEDVVRLADEEAVAHGCRIDWPTVLAPYAGCTDADALDARAGALLAADLQAARTGAGANFLVDLVGDLQLLLWEAFARRWLRPDAERRYRQEIESAMLGWAATCPVPTAERLLALHRAGRLIVRAGAGAPELSADGASYAVPHRFGTERATVLVDCSGALDRRLDSPQQPPLFASMHAAGLLRPFELDGEPREGIAVDMATYRAHGTRAVHVAGMMLWGPGFFTSSAYLTARVVERSLAAMFEAPRLGG